LKDAEKWKKYLITVNCFDTRYRFKKDVGFIYYPVKNEFKTLKGDIEFVDVDFARARKTGTLKEHLSATLSKEEINFLKTAHDIIGTIAILEISKGLEHHEKLIADTLLKINKNIKTVLKKAAVHEGVFRTQKMEYLAGIDTKETLYRENNTIMKLDVEKVYFSIRLSNERKRIMQLVLPGESIMVMFSGAAPYPIVLSKNTKAEQIIGIEINPDGHKYGVENLRLNKIHNVFLINDDVHEAIPKIYQKLIGLKSAVCPSELKRRLKEHPSLIEIYLPDNGLDEKYFPELQQCVVDLKNLGIDIFVHVPHRNGSKHFVPDCEESLRLLQKLGELCKKHNISAVIHLSNGSKIPDENVILENVKKLAQYYDYFYFENSIKSFAKKEDILRMAKTAGFKNICLDIVHLYIVYEDNEKVVSAIKAVQKEFNTYFHIADHDKKTHTCELGKGFIDFEKVLPLVNKGVIEVYAKDENDPVEVIRSYHELSKYHNKKYDRIIMPLPKTADEFLNDALSLSKKGTIIHFYDFLDEKNFDEAKNKIDAACKRRDMNYNILDLVKCGQHAPHIFRICVDFEIL